MIGPIDPRLIPIDPDCQGSPGVTTQTALPMPHVMGRQEWALLLVLSVLWGGAFFFAGVALRGLPPFTLVTLRVGLAALILAGAARLLGVPLARGAEAWRAYLGMGLLNNVVPFCLIVWGQTHIASGLAAILNATTPLLTVVVAHALTDDEKLTRNRLAGVLLGLAGVAVMIGPDALGGLGADVLAQLAVIGAALSYAFAGVWGRRFKRLGIAPMVAARGQVTASSLVMLPIALLIDKPWTLPPPAWPVWGAVLGIALLSTALGYVLYFHILARAGANNLALVTFLIPVTAILLGALVLGEHLAARHFLGMALIGAGLAASDGRLAARRRAPRAA
jgi:drug/metabolite transporter (DMT)-like permease